MISHPELSPFQVQACDCSCCAWREYSPSGKLRGPRACDHVLLAPLVKGGFLPQGCGDGEYTASGQLTAAAIYWFHIVTARERGTLRARQGHLGLLSGQGEQADHGGRLSSTKAGWGVPPGPEPALTGKKGSVVGGPHLWAQSGEWNLKVDHSGLTGRSKLPDVKATHNLGL